MIHFTIPELVTDLREPLYSLEKQLLTHCVAIENWFRQQWRKTPPPFYSSVDLRNSGFKLAPIDTNLFPAGFNNLHADLLPLAIQAVQSTLGQYHPNCQKILLIAESHTRNQFYLENVAALQTILIKAGYDTRLSALREDLIEPQHINLPSGKILIFEPMKRVDDRIVLENFSPCMLLLNNDLSSGIPEILQGISQTISPPMDIGWTKRLKSKHFHHYQQIALEFAALVDIDPWMIDASFRQCGQVDFLRGEGLECLSEQVSSLLTEIKQQYQKNQITEPPFVVIKADSGTYGMGILMVHSVDELQNLNRKQRLEMTKTKGNLKINKVILQEGVYTFEQWQNQGAAEPVVYMIGSHVVGGFYRIHSQRGNNENLNAPGMHFEPLAFQTSCNNPDQHSPADCQSNRFYTYGVIARLAALAAAREIAEIAI